MTPVRLVKALAGAAAITLVASACGGGFQKAETPGGGANASDKLTIAMQFTPRANWALESDDAFVLTQVGCLETLLSYDATAGELKPKLATAWKQSTPTTWDFTLRDGVKFQDGTDLTAEVVVTNLNRLLKAQAPPRAFRPADVAKVTAVDARTVRVTTTAPSALVPYRLASVNTGMLAAKAFTDQGTDPKGTCTGPFTVTGEVPKQSVSLQRNDAYWGTKAALAAVEGKFLPEGATRATQVQTGESQIALAVPAASLPELEKDANLTVGRVATPRTTGLYFNNAKAPFDKPDVRKAVQAALDLNAIAATVYDGGAKPAAGPFAPEEPWAPQGGTPVTRDVATAKRLLSESGAKLGTLTLIAYKDQPEFADLAAVIQANLAEVGIKVEIKQPEYAAIEADLLSGNYDLALLSRNFLIDIADPIGALTADYTCKGGYNISRFCDQAVDAELAKAAGLQDAKARHAVYASVAKKLQDDAVTVYVVHQVNTSAIRKNVQNFTADPLNRYAITPELKLG